MAFNPSKHRKIVEARLNNAEDDYDTDFVNKAFKMEMVEIQTKC